MFIELWTDEEQTVLLSNEKAWNDIHYFYKNYNKLNDCFYLTNIYNTESLTTHHSGKHVYRVPHVQCTLRIQMSRHIEANRICSSSQLYILSQGQYKVVSTVVISLSSLCMSSACFSSLPIDLDMHEIYALGVEQPTIQQCSASVLKWFIWYMFTKVILPQA